MALNFHVVPSRTCLPALLHFLELSFVLFLQFGDTQAILIWNFGLQDDLHLLRYHGGSVEFVRVLNALVLMTLSSISLVMPAS